MSFYPREPRLPSAPVVVVVVVESRSCLSALSLNRNNKLNLYDVPFFIAANLRNRYAGARRAANFPDEGLP